ncbi:MAG: hypothetical protein M0006_15715 [Magnetospirillum sp.]|nr:hypothetical protein [Magnetospirillum sp.]
MAHPCKVTSIASRQLRIDIGNADATLVRNTEGQWELWDTDDNEAKAPLTHYPSELPEDEAKQRAREFLRGYTAGIDQGSRQGRANLQLELRRLIDAAPDR